MSDYQEYLQTEHWLRLAEETKRLAGYRCQVCNSPLDLCAHHRTYEHRGDELQSDLICLCRDCHERFHEKGKYEKVTEYDFSIASSPLAALPILPPPFAQPESTTRPACVITVKISPSGDLERDARRAKNAFYILTSKPGNDRFRFEIDGKIATYPNEIIDITEAQLERLAKLIGPDSWTIDPLVVQP